MIFGLRRQMNHFFQAVDHGQGPLFYKIYYKLWEWWRREICIFAQLSQLRAIPHPCIHTHGFSRTHINEGQFWAGANPWGLPVLVLKKQLLHTVTENTVHPLVSLALHTIPKVHFSVLFESKHQKTLFRVTYFLQIRVGGILQISKNQSFCLSVSCVLYEIGQYS